MDYYPGMMEEQDAYEDSMQHAEEMTIGYKDWDFLLLTICYRETELESRLRNPDWPENHRLDFQAELEKLGILKKKVIDKIR
jgi:hypothetical protein